MSNRSVNALMMACLPIHHTNGDIRSFLQLFLGAMHGHHARVHVINCSAVETEMVTVTQIETATIMVDQNTASSISTNSPALPLKHTTAYPASHLMNTMAAITANGNIVNLTTSDNAPLKVEHRVDLHDRGRQLQAV
jgi:hypothetical protein